jgi:hypothetical protein
VKKRREQTKEKGKPFIWLGRKRDGRKPVGLGVFSPVLFGREYFDENSRR